MKLIPVIDSAVRTAMKLRCTVYIFHVADLDPCDPNNCYTFATWGARVRINSTLRWTIDKHGHLADATPELRALALEPGDDIPDPIA